MLDYAWTLCVRLGGLSQMYMPLQIDQRSGIYWFVDQHLNAIGRGPVNTWGLVIPLKGRWCTWSNMQDAQLLEKLDWGFSSESWTLNYPNTFASCLSKPISDHAPCLIQIGTNIPKAGNFRFENFWLQEDVFKDTIKRIWEQPVAANSSTQKITAKFKRLGKGLKIWAKSLSNLTMNKSRG